MVAQTIAAAWRSCGYARRSGRLPSFWHSVVIALVLTAVCLPFLYVIWRAGQVGFTRGFDLLWRPRVAQLLFNTVALMVSVTAATVLLGAGAAWCVERTDLPGRQAWAVLFSMPLSIPAFVGSYTWVSISPIFEGYGGAVLILTLATYPLVYLPVSAALRGLDPALEEVSQSLGRNRWQTFWRVVLPQLKPALGAGALLVSLHMLAEFGALALLRYQTFTTAIFEEYELEFSNASAALLAFVLLLLCVPLIVFELRVRGGVRLAKVGKGARRPVTRVPLGRWRWPVLGVFTALMTAALLVPLGTLAYWLTHGTSAGIDWGSLLESTGDSLSLSLAGALCTVLCTVPLVLAAMRYKALFGDWLDRIPYVVHALPGLVIALSLAFFSITYVSWAYQSWLLILVAYVVLYLPLAQASVRAALEQLPTSLEDVGRALGHSPWSVFCKITLPCIAPGVAAGGALVFLQLMKELTATLILAPIGVDTLSMQVWSETNNSAFAAAAPYAAVLILISGIPVHILRKAVYFDAQ
ncbi:ABC transporter permease [Candidimonas nitroreducens]|uniref:Iron ABC transporter permease n=1 Tax=Candidimonas nitroreducens TaxID=683354 RepID=A0A225M978_9BURK|nr:iron ABC transporter permease [Candidimonas nitroreducens]OWT56101.1 iron ABC transporter permease [Candidimonas nitroreducens]